MSDALARLSEAGVSMWLDDLSRRRLVDGSLARMVSDRHVGGVTTNPTIFAHAIEGSDCYDDLDRPNLFVKIPAARQGLEAISACLAEGASINVTLLFSPDRYDQVVEAVLAGTEGAREAGRDLSGIVSVASFFVSRADTEIDRRLDGLGGERFFSSERWRRLEKAGARRQRLLWASTSVKDPAYEDTRYVTDLIAPDAVNTMPEATMNAFADHGTVPARSIRDTYAEAHTVPDELAGAGVDYADVVQVLEDEG